MKIKQKNNKMTMTSLQSRTSANLSIGEENLTRTTMFDPLMVPERCFDGPCTVPPNYPAQR